MKDIYKELVYFLNTLPTVRTIDRCQGPDYGGETDYSLHTDISFECFNLRVLGFLASIDNVGPFGLDELDGEEGRLLLNFNAKWAIYVFSAEDLVSTSGIFKALKQGENKYIYYSLSPGGEYFENPSEIYSDFSELLKYYKWKWKKVKKNW